MMDPCGSDEPQRRLWSESLLQSVLRERVGESSLARIHWFGLFGLCGPEFQKPFQIGDVVLNS